MINWYNTQPYCIVVTV